jgi:purine-nucleoside phosphorylase
LAVILVTGWGKFFDYVKIEQSIDYAEIAHFPKSTVEFHKGKLIFGTIGDCKVVAMQGRFHLYEGRSLQQVTYLIRVLKQLGITPLFLSDTTRGINKTYKKSDLVLLDNHTNLQCSSPLKGLNRFIYCGIFPDMNAPYDMKLNSKLMQKAQELQIHLKEGKYASVFGPQLDTRVQYRFLGIIGADLLGINTTTEVTVANQLKLP